MSRLALSGEVVRSPLARYDSRLASILDPKPFPHSVRRAPSPMAKFPRGASNLPGVL